VTNASVHDSQPLDDLLTDGDKKRNLYADSACSGEKQENVIKKNRMNNQVHEKGYRNKPVTEAQNANNGVKSKTRSRVVTGEGIPVEYTFTPGSSHDMQGLRGMPLNLPEGSILYADAACTDYNIEDMLSDDGIRLLAARKANSKRPHEPWVEYLISIQRKRIEASFSDIAKYLPKTIHAVTQNGFLVVM
ncbi:hypothetical protein EZS27_036345, partial [termite gut metagenome]